jgi:ATP-dependent exoDNAse (exonuclease V) beta subunit
LVGTETFFATDGSATRSFRNSRSDRPARSGRVRQDISPTGRVFMTLLNFPQPDPIPDATERRLALDIARSFIIEAPAGSGKTGLLIQRLLKLLASESVTDPAQILAITFTRKATHEMRDRVLEQLGAAAKDIPPANHFDRETRPLAQAALGRDRALGWNLLDHPDRLNISTIDALCIQIARSLPVVTGAGGQTPIDDASDLYTQAARQTLALLGGSDRPLSTALELLLLHRDGDLANCESLIAEMLQWRDQWGNLIPLTGEQLTDEYLETQTLPRLNHALEQAICRALTRLDALMPPALCHQLADLARRMSAAEGYKGAESPIALCRELHTAPGTAAHDLDHWRALAHLLISPSSQDWRKERGLQSQHLKFVLAPTHKAELIDLLNPLSETPALREALCALTNLPPLTYPAEQWRITKALFRVLSHALVELQLVFAQTGSCDFTEFSLLARAALLETSSTDDLAAATGFNLQHLLVDEMQDTSTSQYDLIRLLTRHWDAHSQTVFLVGDPKQSIYLFRQARVARFIDTLNARRLGDLPLTPLYLTTNFRSQANLVASFNETFAAIFPPPEDQTTSGVSHPRGARLGSGARVGSSDPELVPYRPAHANRPRTEGPDLVWHANPLPYSADAKAPVHHLQTVRSAAEIRAIVQSWRTRALPHGRTEPWTIAVLVRNRKHLLEIVKAFKATTTSGAPGHASATWVPSAEDPIPYRAVKTEPLAERQGILDLLTLTRALLHPADRTAWLALLRTPFCGLTLADLHLLTGADDPAFNVETLLELLAERGDLLSEDGIARLEPFYSVIAAALAQRGSLPVSQLIHRTWRAFSAHAFTTADEQIDIQRYFELLDELESEPEPLAIGRLERKIENLYAAPSTAADAVDLMTIHNAKGLEWDVVLIPELESGSARNQSRLLNWLEIETGSEADPDIAHGIIAPVASKGSESEALNQWIRSIDSGREAAERKRLFYVACTRAREELHLFAAPSRTAKGELSPASDSLLKAAWPAAQPIFEAQNSEAAEQPGPLERIAAAADLTLVPPTPPRLIHRIPLSAFAANPGTVPTDPAAPGLDSAAWVRQPQTTRPEGSFEARILGNATHAFLELLTQRAASGQSWDALKREATTWSPRIQTLLRAAGLAPESIPAATSAIQRSMTRTLEDPTGRWLLTPHPEASTETSISTPAETIRLDRTFLAGPEPLSTGQTHLWIIDYKTGSHAAEGLEAFLAAQKALYAPQLETYAAHLAQRGHPIRLALYYPAIPTLLLIPIGRRSN